MIDNVFLCIFLIILCFEIVGICFFAYIAVKVIVEILNCEEKQ